MANFNTTIFDSSSAGGNTGQWFSIGDAQPDISLNTIGLEAGATLTVSMSNSPTTPIMVGEPSAAILTTINGGSPSITPISCNAAWIQVVKVPGPSPATTTVYLFGHIG